MKSNFLSKASDLRNSNALFKCSGILPACPSDKRENQDECVALMD